MSQHILIIEDESDIAENLSYNLVSAGFTAQIAASGEKGLELALDKNISPSLILLDLMLPRMSGLELCRRLRSESQTRLTPIIILTAKASEDDKIIGLETGADDYIIKPFSLKEVVARVRAVLRRKIDIPMSSYKDEKLSIDFEERSVLCSGQKVKLTRKEFDLLTYLITNSRRVVRRQNLLETIWGYNYFNESRTVDVHIRRLRQKLGDCAGCIETVIGAGYRFINLK